VRFAALAAGKMLLTPQPRLRTGFFNTLSAANLPANDDAALREASTSAGAAKYGVPLGTDATDLRVDIIIVGSVAVCPQTGARVGKGASPARARHASQHLLFCWRYFPPLLPWRRCCRVCLPPLTRLLLRTAGEGFAELEYGAYT
jgi:hypothetical protein